MAKNTFSTKIVCLFSCPVWRRTFQVIRRLFLTPSSAEWPRCKVRQCVKFHLKVRIYVNRYLATSSIIGDWGSPMLSTVQPNASNTCLYSGRLIFAFKKSYWSTFAEMLRWDWVSRSMHLPESWCQSMKTKKWHHIRFSTFSKCIW